MLTYNDDTHQYFIDGVEVPSVSRLVSFACGSEYGNVPEEVLKRAGEYGTAVHNAIEKYETSNETEPLFSEQVEAYVKLKNLYQLKVASMEQMVTDGINFGGRYDILDKDGFIWDIKTTSKTYPKYDDKWSWQLSFYSYGLYMSDENYIYKDKAYIIYIPKKGKSKLVIVNLHPIEEVEMVLEMYEEQKNESVGD